MTIGLLDGRQVDIADVSFDASSYTWIYTPTGEDVTWLLDVQERQRFEGFDRTVFNDLIYTDAYKQAHQGNSPPPVGSKSTWDNLWTLLKTDPFGAPIDTASSGVRTGLASIFKGLGKNIDVTIILILAVIGLILLW